MGKHNGPGGVNDTSRPHFGSLGMAVRRWRNVRGFGVHSPAAYAIMRDVVRPSRLYGLYSYHTLDCLLEQAQMPESEYRSTRKRMRMLLRLCRHLAPHSLKTEGGGEPLAKWLPYLSGIRCSASGETPGLWVAANIPANPEKLADALKEGAAVILTDRAVSMTGTIIPAMKGGVIVIMEDTTLLMPIDDSAISTYYA